MSGRLSVRGLSVSFGGVRALDGVDLDVGEGELVGLIGPNGAGKTTTIDAISGFVPHLGVVALDGVDVSDRSPHDRVAAGLARTWQSLELFDDLTVAENCQVAASAPSLVSTLTDAVRPRRRRDLSEVTWALDLLDLGPVAQRLPSELSLGQRKLAAVARALAGSPRLVLLDEPAAGLDSHESLVLGEKLRRVIEHGVAILLVDHDMALVLGVCDRLFVLDFGRMIASGTPAEIRADQRVIDAYLGSSHRTVDELAAEDVGDHIVGADEGPGAAGAPGAAAPDGAAGPDEGVSS